VDRPSGRAVRLLQRNLLPLFVVSIHVFAPAVLRAEDTGVPMTLQPMTVSFFIDRKLPKQMRPSIEEAFRRVSDSRCQAILNDFRDPKGRTLELNLAATGQGLPAYLGWVIFYDGRSTRPCEDRRTLAWTNPGSRAVLVCWDQFAINQRTNLGYTANTIIHETLHTLGLGETPPDPREITARVAQRCGN
jgi:hypothetical protein